MQLDIDAISAGFVQQPPMQPLQLQGVSKVLTTDTSNAQSTSFIKQVSYLAQMFKFLPKADQQLYESGTSTLDLTSTYSKQMSPSNPSLIWGQGEGQTYTNLDIEAGASDWNMVTGVDTSDTALLDEINEYFKWDDIKAAGGDESYYDIASSGDINSMSDKDAFDLMASMLESSSEAYSVFQSIFGDASSLTDDQSVINSISSYLSSYTDVDPHSLGILKMFFGMETDFINTLDAFVNCQTYWGGDLTNPTSTNDLGNFSATLKAKVDAYISDPNSNLSDAQKTAAQDLENKWFDMTPARYDMVGDQFTSQLVGTDGDCNVNTSGSWVEFFCDKMQTFENKFAIGIAVADTLNRSAQNKYKTDEKTYQDKKDDAIMDDVAMQKALAKKRAENKQTMQKFIGRHSNVAKATNKISAKRAKPAASAHKNVQPVKPKPVVSQSSAAAISSARASASARQAAAPKLGYVPNIAMASKKQDNSAQQNKNKRKVI